MRTVKFGIVALGLISATMVHAQEQGNGDKIFAKRDVNADGGIDKAEFMAGKEGKTKKDGTPIDFDKIFAKKDLNSDGKIDKDEFDAARAKRAEHLKKKQNHDGSGHFEKMDTNGDGLIDKAEFAAKSAGKIDRNGAPIDVEKRFAKLDANGDGSIDKAEIEAVKKQKSEKQD